MPEEILTVKGVPVAFDFQRPVNATQRETTMRTLNLLPVSHLQTLPTIVVGDRPPQGGGAVPASGPGGPLIRMNVARYRASFNQHHLNTLLHEIGHIVDWTNHCIGSFYRQPANLPCLRLFRRRAPLHVGTTGGEQEIYADAYSGLFRRARSILGLDWMNTSELYAAVLCSPPFNCCRGAFDSFIPRRTVDFGDDVDVVTPSHRRGRGRR